MLDKRETRPSQIIYSILYGARIIRVAYSFIRFVDTSKRKVLFYLNGSKKELMSSFIIVCMLVNMSQNHENSKKTSYMKGVTIDKAIERFLEDENKKKKKNKEVGSYSLATSKRPHDETSTRAFVFGKTSITRMNIVKKTLIEDTDSKANDDKATFMDSIRCTKDQIEEISLQKALFQFFHVYGSLIWIYNGTFSY